MMKRQARRATAKEHQTEETAEPLAGQEPRSRADPAWQVLYPGDRVTAYTLDGAASTGIVDTMTTGTDIRFDGVTGRRMIHGDENITITGHTAGGTRPYAGTAAYAK